MNQSSRRIAYAMGILVVAVMLAVLAAPAAAAAESCLVAHVPRDFVLPDGSSHPAGPLRVCLERNLNPSVELQKISVDGSPVGLFQSKAFTAENSDVLRPVFYFGRTEGSDEWALLGLAEPAKIRGDSSKSIRFARSGTARQEKRTESRVAEITQPHERDSLIVLAAR